MDPQMNMNDAGLTMENSCLGYDNRSTVYLIIIYDHYNMI
jgi:hypothetical protein